MKESGSKIPNGIELIQRAESLIEKESVLTLATAEDRIAWAAPVYFVYIKSKFYFFSSPDSRHIKEALQSGQAAATIFLPASSWEDIKGIQMTGMVETGFNVLESMNAVSFEQYIIDDEIIGASCNLLKGICVDEEHLAFDTVKQAGPGGHYLMSPHTLKHMRSEYFEGNGISHTGSRSSCEKKGGQDTWNRANEMAKSVIYKDTLPKINKEIEAKIRGQFNIALDIGHDAY